MRSAARIAAAIAAAGAASAAYQQIAEAADRHRFPPPGRLVDIGGRRMHLLAAGGGSPAVVIIPALASNVLEWVRVQRAAAAETTVIVYDRAGVGWSDPPRGRLTVDAMADDLHALLVTADVKPPYIIAGHSLGGVIARRFQARHPGDVAGMLLIDSSHEDQAQRLPGRPGVRDNITRAARRQFRILGVRRLAASFGLVDGVNMASLARETVPEHQDAARAITLSAKQRRIAVRELLLLSRLRGEPPSFGALPLTVLSAGNARRRQWSAWAAWCQLQDELAALSSDSAHMYAVNADHSVHLDDPEVVVQAIRELLRHSRQAHPGQRPG